MMKRFFLSLSLLSLCLFASPGMASAVNWIGIFHGVDCTRVVGAHKSSDSAVCKDKVNGTSNPVDNLLRNITDIVAVVAGAAAVIILLVGAIKYVTSGGDSNAVSNAKSTIINALIGLAVIVLARAIITYVVRRL